MWQGCLGAPGWVLCTRLQLVRFSPFLLCQIVLDQIGRQKLPRPLSMPDGSSAPQGSNSPSEAGQLDGASAVQHCQGQQRAEACGPVAAATADVPLGQPPFAWGLQGTLQAHAGSAFSQVPGSAARQDHHSLPSDKALQSQHQHRLEGLGNSSAWLHRELSQHHA